MYDEARSGRLRAACALSLALAPVAEAQKSGGVLIMSHFDSPASMSMHEEATGAVNRPMMGVFNNLVMFDQHVAQNSMGSIVPDLATGWSWNEEGTELTMPLRKGVRCTTLRPRLGRSRRSQDRDCAARDCAASRVPRYHTPLPRGIASSRMDALVSLACVCPVSIGKP